MPRLNVLATCLILITLRSIGYSQSGAVVYEGADLIIGDGSAPIESGVLVVQNGYITAAGPKASVKALVTYRKSVAHFKEETKNSKVQVELQNHALMDPIQAKLDQLKARKKGGPNPFVVGQGNYQKFVDVMAACTDVNIARRKGI